MRSVSVEDVPGGVGVASGGTRSLVKLDRPWQTEIVVGSEACPFEMSQQEETGRFEDNGIWRVLVNSRTPLAFHRLIVPLECWPTELLRVLGGPGRIAAVLRITETIGSEQEGEIWLGVHIGPGAGQNLPHLHYHLIRPVAVSHLSSGDDNVSTHYGSSSLVVFEEGGFRVVLGGHRAGQCFIFPLRQKVDDQSDSLAAALSSVILLYGQKFRSLQGLPPDYMIGIKLRGACFGYATFIPILNNWGFTEYMGLHAGKTGTLSQR